MDDEDNRIIMKIALCKTEECLEVIIRPYVPSGNGRVGDSRHREILRASAMSRSIPVCPPIIEELRRVRCAPI